MPTPLPEAFAAILRSDATAALAAAFIIGNHHSDVLHWVARTIAPTPVEPPKPNGNGPRRREAMAPKAKPRAARKPPRNAAYHARRREERDCDDQSLLEAMRSAPEAMIGDWAEAIGKGRSSIISALKRLREAGLVESVEGKWRLTEPEAPREPPPKWVAPLNAGREHRAHA